jgi:alkylation response protein AidB-like acyl-CoA dehydrogenase
MDFSFTEEQTQIRDLSRQIFAENCGDAFQMSYRKKQRVDNTLRYSRETWKLLAESGLLGTAIPESLGGSGFGLVELCQMLEEQGRHVAPVPLLPALVYGGLTLAKFGNSTQQEKFLPKLANGELLLTAAIAEESMALALRMHCVAKEESGKWILNGLRVAVPYAQESAALLVAADTAKGKAVFIVEPQAGLTCEFTHSGNHEPLYSVNFKDAKAELLGTLEQGKQVLQFILDHGAIACAATMIGITEESTRRTALYTSERKQFEMAISNFQNTTMKMADCYIDIESLRSAYFEALWKLSEGKACEAEVAVAKYWSSMAGHRVTHTCQHLHGGIGADVEYPLHRYYLWFKQMDLTLGGATKQLASLGALLAKDPSLNLVKNLA